METATYSSPIILKDISITEHYVDLIGIWLLRLTDESGKVYLGTVRYIDGDTVNIWMKDAKNKSISLKYSFFDGCLLDQELKKKDIELTDLIV